MLICTHPRFLRCEIASIHAAVRATTCVAPASNAAESNVRQLHLQEGVAGMAGRGARGDGTNSEPGTLADKKVVGIADHVWTIDELVGSET